MFQKSYYAPKYQPYKTALSEFVNMREFGRRCVIQYLHLKVLTPNIKADLDSTLQESVPKFPIIKYCVADKKKCHNTYNSTPFPMNESHFI